MTVFPRHITAARRLALACLFACTLLVAPAAHAASGGAAISTAPKKQAKPKAKGSTASGARPKPVAKNGVKRAQRWLAISQTGRHDDTTRKVVRRFQELRGLRTFGIVDRETYLEVKAAFLLAEPGNTKVKSASATGGGGAAVADAGNAFLLPEGLAPISTLERSILDKISKCESGGNAAAISSNKLYRGKYQFDRGTWKTVGGSGDPAKATAEEQDERAAILLRRRGVQPWPSCGRGLL